MQAIFGLLTRHALTVLGGYLAAKGLDGAGVEAVLGAVTTLAGVGWSFYQKKKSGALEPKS